MPGNCAPPPGYMNTRSGFCSASCVKTRRGSAPSSRAAASSAVSATRTRRWAKARRPSFSVWATSAKAGRGWRAGGPPAGPTPHPAPCGRGPTGRWAGRASRFRPGQARRGLFQHGMGIGAADAQAVDGGAAGVGGLRPILQRGGHAEGRGVEVQRGVRRGEVQRGRDLAMVQGQRGLDEARDACGGIQMADVRLDRPDAAWRHAVPGPKALASAATSIGSPMGVPVPWHST
jgi:hypothetical protein